MRYNINNNMGEFVFFQLPKSIQFNEEYKELSIEARYLYMLMYDRNKISISNNWFDENGDIYIYFSIESICEEMKVGNKKAIKLKRELINSNLIEEVRQGINKPNIIYVNQPSSDVESTGKCENDISGSVKMTLQDMSKRHGNNNKYNNNKIINSVSSIEGISMEDFYNGKY